MPLADSGQGHTKVVLVCVRLHKAPLCHGSIVGIAHVLLGEVAKHSLPTVSDSVITMGAWATSCVLPDTACPQSRASPSDTPQRLLVLSCSARLHGRPATDLTAGK